MTTLNEIEKAVELLTPEQLSQFRDWFARYDAEQWDAAFEKDAAAGLLDKLGDQAIQEFENGNYTEL